MPDYFAAIWNPDDLRGSERAAELLHRCKSLAKAFRVVFENPGVVVLAASAGERGEPATRHDVQVMEGPRGVLLGTVFRAFTREQLEDDAPAPRAILTEQEVDRVIASNGRELIQRFWGDYVAIFRSDGWRCAPTHNTITGINVLRSPAATIPCFHTSTGGVHLYFSSVGLCADAGVRRFTIDWMNLARNLLGPTLPGATDLDPVREVLPGIVEHCRGGVCSQQVLWNPVWLTRDDVIHDPKEAARQLRAVTRACVRTWASPHETILLGLSGGLDSSVVLSCLHRPALATNVLCINQYADDSSSDERHYARASARTAGCELIEHRRTPDIDLCTALHTHRSATSPGLRIPAIDRIEPDLARRRGATALFRGEGGDELFCRNQLPLYVADFLRMRGFHPDVLGLALHAATMQGVTAWQVLGRALWDAFIPRPWNMAATLQADLGRATLLRPDVIAQLLREMPATSLPYARSTREAPPGRLWQISVVCARRSLPNPHWKNGDPVVVYPLLSQPLIELCLRIPTWFQMLEKRDRSLTRTAFASDLTPEVVQRRDKGGAEPLVASMLQRNLPFLREMLLDGVVARQGILDLALLESALADAPSPDSVTTVPIFELLGAEIWARAWHGETYQKRQDDTSAASFQRASS